MVVHTSHLTPVTAGDVSTQITLHNIWTRMPWWSLMVRPVCYKTVCDKGVWAKGLGKVIFRQGQSVQVYRRIGGGFNVNAWRLLTSTELNLN